MPQAMQKENLWYPFCNYWLGNSVSWSPHISKSPSLKNPDLNYFPPMGGKSAKEENLLCQLDIDNVGTSEIRAGEIELPCLSVLI